MTARSPSPTDDVADAVTKECRRLVDECRRFSTSRWGRRTESGETVADVVAQLVALLAALEHELSANDSAAARVPRPAPYPAALADRLAVVGHDLSQALRVAPANSAVRQTGATAIAAIRRAREATLQR